MLKEIVRKYFYWNFVEDEKKIIKMGLPPRILIQNIKFKCVGAQALDAGCLTLYTIPNEQM